MNTPLIIFPMLLFLMSMLALASGIGVIYALRHKRGGAFTTFIWFVFSASISTGFVTFGLFISYVQQKDVLALVISTVGILAVMGAGRLATW